MAQKRKTIFVSATTQDLGSFRKAVSDQLLRHDVFPVTQDNFPPTYKSVRDMLKERIAPCDAVVCLVGMLYGAEPRERPDGQPRRSYTQMEYHLARELGKPVFVFIASDQAKFDHKRRWRLFGGIREGDAERALQRIHRTDLKKRSEVYRHFHTRQELSGLIGEIDFAGIPEAGQAPAGIARPTTKGSIPIRLPYASIGPLFKGREHSLEDLHQRLIGQNHNPAAAGTNGHSHVAVVKQAIKGLGGVGKTRLAVEYAWKHAADYSALLFAGVASEAVLQQEIAALCEILHPGETGLRTADQDTRFHATLDWLNANRDWLLILDNADTAESVTAVKSFTNQIRGGHVIVTSRWTNWGGGMPGFDLNVLEPGPARDYLLQATAETRVKTARDPEVAAELAEALGGLALALEQSAAYIEWQKGTSLPAYLEIWQREQASVMGWHNDALTESYSRSVATTWQTTLDILGPGPRAALNLIAWLDPAPIPRAMFETEEAQEIFAESLKQEAGDRRRGTGTSLSSALAELAAYSLIHFDLATGATFSAHRLVQEVTRTRIPEGERKGWIERCLGIVDDYAPGDSNDIRTWPVWDPLRPHAAAIVRHADEAGIADPTARLMNDLGLLLKTKALHAEAEPLMRRALAIDEQSFGPEHPDVAVDLNNLALLLQATNRLAEAEPLMRRALAIDEQSLGPEHPNVAIRLNNLAELLRTTNRLAEAEPLMRRALASGEQSLGPEHPNVASCLNNLAQLLQATNRLAEAEPLMRKVLTIFEKNLGSEHPNVATAINNLALLLQRTSRFEEAEPLMRKVLTIFEKNLGPEHPNVATAINNLALLLQATDRLDEAEPLMRRALAIDERSYGLGHPDVAIDLANLARLLEDTGRLADALPLLERARAILQDFQARTGYEHPHWQNFDQQYAQMKAEAEGR